MPAVKDLVVSRPLPLIANAAQERLSPHKRQQTPAFENGRKAILLHDARFHASQDCPAPSLCLSYCRRPHAPAPPHSKPTLLDIIIQHGDPRGERFHGNHWCVCTDDASAPVWCPACAFPSPLPLYLLFSHVSFSLQRFARTNTGARRPSGLSITSSMCVPLPGIACVPSLICIGPLSRCACALALDLRSRPRSHISYAAGLCLLIAIFRLPVSHARVPRSDVNCPARIRSVGSDVFPRPFIRALGVLKKAAALTNLELNQLSKEKVDVILKVVRCVFVCDGAVRVWLACSHRSCMHVPVRREYQGRSMLFSWMRYLLGDPCSVWLTCSYRSCIHHTRVHRQCQA